MNTYDADVIVVGCGPVGVMAALRCAQRGLTVIALEREPRVYPLPRAIGMDDEVQDLFARAGLLDALRANSTPFLGGDFVDAGGTRIVGIDVPLGTLGALGHPPMTAFDQPSVERFLRTAAVEHGVDMRLEVDVTGLTTAAGVQAHLADGTSVKGRWLIGADGAKSTIRELVGIDLVDQAFDQTWLVVDTTLLDANLPLPTLPRQHCDPARIVTFVPGHDTRRRWEFQLNADETRDQASEPAFLDRLLASWGTPEQLQVDRSAVYRFHATVASTFNRQGVFLAGDAAHQMPPFNGQGMCSGMRDAENLAWKLAAVAAGQAPEALLDTYDEERRPHATSQVAHSVDAGRLIEAIAHDGERALESGYGRRKFPKLGSGRLIHGDHRLVGMPLPRPADESFQIANGWTLLNGPSATDSLPSLWSNLNAKEHRIDNSAYGDTFPPSATVVVRPDRFVAAVTNDLELVTAKFASTLAS